MKLWKVDYKLIGDLDEKERDFIERTLGRMNDNNNYVITEDDLEELKKGLENDETKNIAQTLLNLYKANGDVEINISR